MPDNEMPAVAIDPRTVGDLTADALGFKVTVQGSHFVLIEVTHRADRRGPYTTLRDESWVSWAFPSATPVDDIEASE